MFRAKCISRNSGARGTQRCAASWTCTSAPGGRLIIEIFRVCGRVHVLVPAPCPLGNAGRLRPGATAPRGSRRVASRRRDFCFLAAHIASQMSDNEPPCKMEISVREKRPRPRRIYMRMPVTRPRDLLEPRFRPFFPSPRLISRSRARRADMIGGDGLIF